MENLIFRVDASSKIGTGHLMRCLALGQAWKDAGGKIVFISTCKNENLLNRLRAEGIITYLIPKNYPDPSDWNHVKNIINDYPSTWIVLDGYHFDENYQKWIKESGHNLLVIDDMAHLKHYYSDLILNQNLHSYELKYSCEPSTTFLFGTKYVLLRREFLKWKHWKRKIPDLAYNLLVTMGGGDPYNITSIVIQALDHVNMERLNVVVVVGASNPYKNELQNLIYSSKLQIRLKHDVKNMPRLMAWADIAIAASGSTSWELSFMGLPKLLIVFANNQKAIAEYLHKAGVAINLGWYNSISSLKLAFELRKLMINKSARSKMAQLSQKLVDGLGGYRISTLLSGFKAKS